MIQSPYQVKIHSSDLEALKDESISIYNLTHLEKKKRIYIIVQEYWIEIS
jgi:hypothetical protein